ncbi:hypothetical protein GCM10022402_26260 [Salinactinospora qingdaonensis]|uniref:Metal-binding protein n=2 Tax=Salinactinospora qingdaonensis TaxID=702744 RepID=A0ABP7FWB8_9ACTN
MAPHAGDLGVEMARVPQDAEIQLDFRLEAVMDGVLVTGAALARMSAECSRCLDPISDEVEVDFQELFRYPSDDSLGIDAGGGEGDGAGADEDYHLEGDLIDLEQVVRDALILALPLSPLCRGDCPGLCAECGAKLADVEADHSHGDRVDPRWEALRSLSEEFGDQ